MTKMLQSPSRDFMAENAGARVSKKHKLLGVYYYILFDQPYFTEPGKRAKYMQRSENQGAEALNGENKNRKLKIETQIGKDINIKYCLVIYKMTKKIARESYA